jgi:hypothetical protein
MSNVLGQINKLNHLAKHNKHYSLMNFHFSAESDSFCNTLKLGGEWAALPGQLSDDRRERKIARERETPPVESDGTFHEIR